MQSSDCFTLTIPQTKTVLGRCTCYIFWLLELSSSTCLPNILAVLTIRLWKLFPKAFPVNHVCVFPDCVFGFQHAEPQIPVHIAFWPLDALSIKSLDWFGLVWSSFRCLCVFSRSTKHSVNSFSTSQLEQQFTSTILIVVYDINSSPWRRCNLPLPTAKP